MGGDWELEYEWHRQQRQDEIPKQIDNALSSLGDIAEKLDNVLSKFDPAETNRIFLSHKSCDKPSVRRYMAALRTIGLDPWLDEDALSAGSHLDHALLQGLKESCATVFFITPNFQYDGFLKQEIEYAIAEERERNGRFTIITILLDGATEANIPPLLKRFVWRAPESELQAFVEIIRGLPVRPGPPVWRTPKELQ
jgi:TIR domain